MTTRFAWALVSLAAGVKTTAATGKKKAIKKND